MRLFKPKKPGLEKKNRTKELMKKRAQEKAAENRHKGWTALERGSTKAGLSMYLHAATLYKGNFNAVKVELVSAKRRGYLPANFKMPANAKELKKILQKLK